MVRKLILISFVIITLGGCVSKNSYILYDNRGCAYIVERYKDGDGITNDFWLVGKSYRAEIQRLSTEDKPTCPLKKESN